MLSRLSGHWRGRQEPERSAPDADRRRQEPAGGEEPLRQEPRPEPRKTADAGGKGPQPDTAVMEHPRLGSVTLAEPPRARRISITVKPSGEVRLVRPRGVSLQRALEFLERRVEWVEQARRQMAAREAALPPRLQPEERQARIEALRRAAKADLPERIARLSAATGLRYGKLSIRAARTKWGSCSGNNDISLSLFLMTLPEHLRDFVIIHELCHTIHHDHSPRFHALLDRLTGGRERELAYELRRFTIRG